MGDAMVIDSAPPAESPKKPLKRKREKQHGEILTVEERERKIESLNEELKSLFEYFKEVLGNNNVGLESHFASCSVNNVNGMIALLLEERSSSYSKLANEIYEKVKERDCGVTIANVKSSVLYVGQRVSYGVPNADADVLEDETDSALWCWETRDMKLLPNLVRGALRIHRTRRKKIKERITAVLAVISALQEPENHQKHDLMKALEKLNKVLSEADIRLLVESMVQKNGSDMAEKDAKREEKRLIKQLEENKRKVDKEKKQMDRELQREKLHGEKELKQMQENAEKDDKHRDKEEYQMRKQLKRKQEEAERYQRRREREEAELKKQRSIQKQVSIMEQFLKKSKNNPVSESDKSPTSVSPSAVSTSRRECLPESVTFLMDSALSQKDDTDLGEIRKSHLNSWRCLGHSIRLRSKQHWGIRRKPKIDVIKELKLCHSKGPAHYEDQNIESLVDGWGEANMDDKSYHANASSSSSGVQKARQPKQLLQFDKSYRPAFYGIWPKKSNVVGPCHPLKKDPDLDYEVDSDEEWEEEDPGESLSDCDKDGEESLDEARVKADEDDESDDGFFVPDGYLSENEGVQIEKDHRSEADDARSSPSFKAEAECEENSAWFRQQKYLHNLTEHALRKNQPLIITNLMHEKEPFLSNEDLTGAVKLEQMCLQALAMHAFPGALSIEVPSDNILTEEDEEAQIPNSEGNIMLAGTAATILDSDLPKIVSTIQSCPQGMSKVLKSLRQKFPNIPKSHLRSKVHEISDFVDYRWQVKKDILDKMGISISPEKGGGRTKSIPAFFSKRCLPPPGHCVNQHETSPRSTMQTGSASQQQQDSTYSM